MNRIATARQALAGIPFQDQGIEITIPDNAKVDSRNTCVFFVEAIVRPTKSVNQAKLVAYAKNAIRQIRFPRDSEGYDEVGVSIQENKPAAQGTLAAEIFVQYTWRAISGAQLR